MFKGLVPHIREITADELEVGVNARAASNHASSAPDAPEVDADHPLVQEISRLAEIYGGVILSGPPGTSKSFFAAAAAGAISGENPERQEYLQFHASFQYEDFMLGFRPVENGFEFKEGPFLRMVKAASADQQNKFVLVIDELSRADVGRVFGEALTYVERSKRKLPFDIASGETVSVPSNLVIIATMNPFDRGVDEVDAAFERRFAKISMDPDADLLLTILDENGMEELLRNRVVAWFRRINERAQKNPAASVGHAYFSAASDEASLRDIWDYQLKYLVQRAFRRDESTLKEIETAWNRVFHSSDSSAFEAGLGTGQPDAGTGQTTGES